MLAKAVFNVNELAEVLGSTPAAIHAHLSRKNFDAVPPPIRLGRRLVWVKAEVEQWLRQRIDESHRQNADARKVRGRPPKKRTC